MANPDRQPLPVMQPVMQPSLPTVDPMVPLVARIRGRVVENDDVVTLTFRQPAGLPLPRPGQFQMLGLPGVGEVPISVSGYGDAGAVEHTIRAVGGVTRALCALQTGDAILVRGSFGTAWDVDAMGDRDVVVVAGGIGLAPLFPAIDVLLAQTSAKRRVVVYGARRPPERILKTRLSRLRRRAERHGALELHETVDAPDAHWRGHVGVVTQLLAGLALVPERTSALVCGPEIMMRFTADALVALGVDANHIQVSIERSMKCGIGLCGHCQCGPLLACRDGAVTTYPLVKDLWPIRGL